MNLKGFVFGALLFSAVSLPVQAALINLSQTPLFLTTNSISNLFFLIDDSGSMDWEILNRTHWHFCAYDPNAGGSFSSNNCGWEITDHLLNSYGSGGYRTFEYIYHNADNGYNDDCSGTSTNSIGSCTEAGTADWRVYSSDVNLVYYNPSLTYSPWGGACLNNGTLCANASFSAARSSPREGTTGYSVTRDLAGTVYDVTIDNKGFSGTRPLRGTNVNVTNTSNGLTDLWDSHVTFVVNNGSIEVYEVNYAPNTTGINKTSTLKATLTNLAGCYNVLGNQSLVQQVFNGTYAYDSMGASGCKLITQVQTNMANWYEYYRRRGSNAKAAVAEVINLFPNFRYGFSVLNKNVQTFVEMPASNADLASHNQNIINTMFSFEWPPQGTPLRRGLEMVGQYFSGDLNKTSPITESCQQNFTVLITDSLWNGQAPASVAHDEDGDGYKGTFADVARYFYTHDLSPLANEVIPNPYDPATYQHLVSFLVTFGSEGNLVDTDNDGWPNPALGVSSNWGDPFHSELAKLDDVWHGAFNSHGLFTAAQTPDEITDKLIQVLQNITERESSVSSVAQNTTTLQTSSQVFQATFHSKTWKGNLYAYNINLQGTIASSPAWNAGCVLTGGDCQLPLILAANNPGISPSNRVIITRAWDGSNAGIAFRFPSNYASYKVSGVLPTNLAYFLANAPYSANTSDATQISANQTYGEKLLNYLRGVRTEEVQNNGTYQFRDRESILGDIVHSDPLYVSPPNRFYPDDFEASAYSTFKSTYAGRNPMVIAGANDGFLHIFNATTGSEILAFVPGNREIYEHLPNLSKTSYTHEYFVDGSATEADVYVNNAWKTVVVGDLRNGGQGIYALDITDPSTFTEANASNLYLWEFTDKDDPDMGYVYGRITIAKVNSPSGSPKWAALFGNGYNNSASDGYASSTGKAYLFIVYLDGGLDGTWTQGTDYIKIPVGTGTTTTPDGLSTPYAIDRDGDFVVDYVYGGDLHGNLWKFDLRDATPSNWTSQTLFTASYQTAGDQPITGEMVVGVHPSTPKDLNAGALIYFGTGKYLETNDIITVPTTQSFYGIWDKFDGSTVAKSQLLEQNILAETTYSYDSNNDGTLDSSTAVRQLSDYSIDWTTKRGWFINLKVDGSSTNTGERQISRPLLRNEAIVFTTMIPSSSSCSFGGSSWLMEVAQENGGVLDSTPLDLNHDGTFSSADYIAIGDINGDGVTDYIPVSGQKSPSGLTSTPAVFVSPDKESEIKVLNGTGGLTTVRENPGSGPHGRQNWKQIY